MIRDFDHAATVFIVVFVNRIISQIVSSESSDLPRALNFDSFRYCSFTHSEALDSNIIISGEDIEDDLILLVD